MILLLEIFAREAAAKEVSCESNRSWNWGYPVGNQKTCFIEEITIDSQGFSIASAEDEATGGIYFEENKQVSYLPVNVHKIFPNLMGLSAAECSIKTLTKENFKNLKKLKELKLRYNQIEIIQNDVFEDLTSLEELDLGENKLSFIFFACSDFSLLAGNKINFISSINTFQHLKKLRHVWLRGNKCIGEDYEYIDNPLEMATFLQDVSRKCQNTD